MTKAEYEEYVARVNKFYEDEDIEVITSIGREPYFSNSQCDCCGTRLGGT